MRRSTVLAVLALTSMLAIAVGSAAAPHDIGTSNDVHVPEQSVTIVGAQYDINTVGQVQQGEQLQVSVDVDGDTEYSVHLYNPDKQVEASRDGTGDGSVTVSTDGMEPGTHALALFVDGSIQAIHPVVVSDYELSVAPPADATLGEPFNVTVDVGEQVTSSETVKVGVYNDGTETLETATHTGGGTYVATVDPGVTGELIVYGAVRGSGEVAGYPTSTAIANGQTVTIVNQSDDGSAGGSDGGSDDGSGSDSGADDGSSTDDGSGSDDGNQTDGNAGTGDGPQTDDGDGSDDGTPGGEGSTDDGTSDGDSGTEDTNDSEAGSDDEPMGPAEPDANGSDANGSDDDADSDSDTVALSWLVPVVAVIAVAAIGIRRTE